MTVQKNKRSFLKFVCKSQVCVQEEPPLTTLRTTRSVWNAHCLMTSATYAGMRSHLVPSVKHSLGKPACCSSCLVVPSCHTTEPPVLTSPWTPRAAFVPEFERRVSSNDQYGETQTPATERPSLNAPLLHDRMGHTAQHQVLTPSISGS